MFKCFTLDYRPWYWFSFTTSPQLQKPDPVASIDTFQDDPQDKVSALVREELTRIGNSVSALVQREVRTYLDKKIATTIHNPGDIPRPQPVPENPLPVRSQKPSRSQEAIKCSSTVDTPGTPGTKGQKEGSPLFEKLPLEIRRLVYKLLLVSAVPVDGARALKNICRKHKTIVQRGYRPFAGIDTRFLLTCKQAYKEATGILYGNNLQFSNAKELRDFRTEHLLSDESILEGFQSKRYSILAGGRYFHIRSLTLTFATPDEDKAPHGASWTDWSSNFFSRRNAHKWGEGFPALRDLVLDFLDWNLSDDQGLEVNDIIWFFRLSGGLRKLVVRGVKHEGTLQRLKNGLAKDGKFSSENSV